MPSDAFGVDYPHISLDAYVAIWGEFLSYTFDSDDHVYVTPILPEKVLECPTIELENGDKREFVRGWRYRWELSFDTLKDDSNVLMSFIYEHLLDWLEVTGYNDVRIKFIPHNDCSSNWFTVRVLSITPSHPERRWILGQKITMVLETVSIYDTMDYYVP